MTPINYKVYGKEFVAKSKILRALGYCAYCGAENGKPNPRTGSKVVLITHHKDKNISNNDWNNLIPLCQQCHLIANRCFIPEYFSLGVWKKFKDDREQIKRGEV